MKRKEIKIRLVEDWFVYFTYKDKFYYVCFEGNFGVNYQTAKDYVMYENHNWRECLDYQY